MTRRSHTNRCYVKFSKFLFRAGVGVSEEQRTITCSLLIYLLHFQAHYLYIIDTELMVDTY